MAEPTSRPENAGTGDRLDLLCGQFVFTPPHDRLLRDYLPRRVVVHAAADSPSTARPGTDAQLAGLVSLMRLETVADTLGGRAMLNALSTAMFALTLRLASEADKPPAGLLALAGHPRLVPTLAAMFHQPRCARAHDHQYCAVRAGPLMGWSGRAPAWSASKLARTPNQGARHA